MEDNGWLFYIFLTLCKTKKISISRLYANNKGSKQLKVGFNAKRINNPIVKFVAVKQGFEPWIQILVHITS